MQVFIVGSPLETARALDPKRLNRQIQETKVILAALNGAKAWSNHPCVLQYRGYVEWLYNYKKCLEGCVMGDTVRMVYRDVYKLARGVFKKDDAPQVGDRVKLRYRRTKRGYESFDMDKARIVEIIKA